MAKTVAIINSSGYLSDAKGISKETNSRYAKFAKRLVGSTGTKATLDFGWNGDSSLELNKDGVRGESITLNANSVILPGALKINGSWLDDIINACTDSAIKGITATDEQTTVTITENDTSSSDDLPRLTCVIGLHQKILDRLTTVETTLEALFRFEEVYRVGSGLDVDRTGDDNRLYVKLGTGLKFSEVPLGSEDTASVEVDCDSTPTKDSIKPVTSGGVYAAIQEGTGAIRIGLSTDTGNMILYLNEADDSSSSDSSVGSASSDSSDSSYESDSSSSSSDDAMATRNVVKSIKKTRKTKRKSE